jgi:hypothetical protein
MSQPGHPDIESSLDRDPSKPITMITPNNLNQRWISHHKGESNFGDGSEPLFSFYTKNAEEEDDKTMAEHWQDDTDGILIFVSLCVDICMDFCPYKLGHHRPVCFLPLSLGYSPCPSWTLGQILKAPPHPISQTSIRFSPTQTSPYHPRSFLDFLPLSLDHRRSLLPDMLSGFNSLWFLSFVISLTSDEFLSS